MIKPSLLQFRVHMCSSLYEKGVPLEYVERFMAHLSSEMRYYYIRPKNTPQEDLASSTRILKGIVTGELTPLGSERGLVGKIEEFIHENNYNIDTDYDVLEALYCDKRKKWGLPHLFLDKLGPQEKRNFPITPSEVPDLMKHVFFYFNKYFTTVLDSPSNDPALPTVMDASSSIARGSFFRDKRTYSPRLPRLS